jgi:hypothetical protein
MQLKRGAHAPSRAVVGALADHRTLVDGTSFRDPLAADSDRRGRRSAHARRVCSPNS